MKSNLLPGLKLSLGYTLFYLGIIVLIPLSTLFFKTATLTWPVFWDAVTDLRTLNAYRISFGAACLGALVDIVLGFILAWVLVRYRFPARKLLGALIDVPFALPTAIVGITYAALYSADGMMGKLLSVVGFNPVYSLSGIVLVLSFIGLPFVVRTVEPVLQELEGELEEAAASLGANRWQTFLRVIFPSVFPSLVTGFVLAFARGIGEYGSVIFIAGNMPYKTEIAPLLIITKLEQYDYAGATAIAVVMLVVSFILLALIHFLGRKFQGGAH